LNEAIGTVKEKYTELKDNLNHYENE